MKILLINNFYYNRGGDCTYLFSLKNLLEKKGHKIIVFSMNHPDNFESEYSKYFVSYINYAEEIKKQNILSGFKVVTRTIHSSEAKRNLDCLIQEEKPDIAHLQNIHHHITPSIFRPIRKYGIPIIWTLHDYSLICPNTSFLCNGKVCERCKKAKYYWPPIVKCKKNSLAASLVAAMESTAHRIMKVPDLVDFFITPSNFLKDKLLEYGFTRDKVICLNNFLDFDPLSEEIGIGDYCLYVGRISEEKGIATLIDAIEKTNHAKLKLVGDGPLLKKLMSYTDSKNLNDRIEFLGHKNRKEVVDVLLKSKFVVVPSEWYENFPYSILEAFACGKPVIGSSIGGIPELVKNGTTGLLFTPGDTKQLSAHIDYLDKNPLKISEMGQKAKDLIINELNADQHYQRLLTIYEQAVYNK